MSGWIKVGLGSNIETNRQPPGGVREKAQRAKGIKGRAAPGLSGGFDERRGRVRACSVGTDNGS